MLRRYDKITWRGFRFNRKTVRMLKRAEKLCGFRLPIAQGSFNKGGVSASAGTHDGSSVDIAGAGFTRAQRVAAVHALKKVGFAAWWRDSRNGFSPHIHAIPFDDRQVSDAARGQLVSFDLHRNGLANNAFDKTYRPKPKVRWSFTLNRPVKRK